MPNIEVISIRAHLSMLSKFHLIQFPTYSPKNCNPQPSSTSVQLYAQDEDIILKTRNLNNGLGKQEAAMTIGVQC